MESETFPECSGAPMALFSILESLGIKTETTPYIPLEERQKDDFTMALKGVFCKNLFLKDRKGQYFLVVCHENSIVNLKCLKVQLQAHRNFSFASSDDVLSILQVVPGCVTPFALMHETARDVVLALEVGLCTENILLQFHPLQANKTTLISFPDLRRFVEHFGGIFETFSTENQ